MAFTFQPKLVETLKNYSRQDFIKDLMAGLTVGIVALPLAMAFGIASGVDPKAGIYTAIIAGFLISVLGGSRVQIGGPTGAFVGIVYGIIQQYGLDNLLICTLLAGCILFAMGAARLGKVIKFIPYPVTTGFTCGIAVTIFSTQIKDFFGLKIDKVPGGFIEKMNVLAAHIDTLHWPTLITSLAALLIIVLWPKKLARRVPGTIVALVVITGVSVLFNLSGKSGIQTIGTQFGGIPQSLPPLSFPHIDFGNLPNLIQPAITIALLAAIESLLCAVVADGMIDDRHDSDQELMAQGVANIGSVLFGGIPATGAIARTATNIKNGAVSPMAGIIHAATLLLIMLVAAPLAKHIPLAALSAVLVIVAFNMGEWHQFSRLSKWPRSDAAVFLCAFGLTVLIDLTKAVEAGMVMAAILFIKQISETTQITAVDESTETEGSHHSLKGKEIPEGVMIYRIFGAFFFGAADKLETALIRSRQEPKVLILRMRKVLAMDATGLNALEDLYEKLRSKGSYIILSGPHTQPLLTMERAGFIEAIGRENVCSDIDASLQRARQILGLTSSSAFDAPVAATS